jgi:phenylpropionate dioxygenase-like ring-hydroxylating dioxygenase large terminal subunit
VLHGLLWLYPDHSADAWLAAIDAVPSAASAELLSGELEVKSPWFQRDVPMSLDTLIENFMVSETGATRGSDAIMQPVT